MRKITVESGLRFHIPKPKGMPVFTRKWKIKATVIASLNGVMASPDTGSYPASKAGVAKLTEQFALVLGKDGVRVNAVSPGFINAGMSAPIYADPESARVRGGAVPLGRLGEAQDVADAVFYLASDRAAYITGANLLVDGGVSFSLKNQLPRKAPAQPG